MPGSYDVVFAASLGKIVRKFRDWEGSPRLVFSAEEFCWPIKALAADYPQVNRGKRYLNSGGFIGYAADVYAVVTRTEIEDADDDQLFYTRAYLDEKLRKRHRIKLDHKSEIFQNLNGAISKFFVLIYVI